MKPKHILIVDDEASFTNLLKINLERRTGHTVEAVNRAHEAIPAARKHKPDLILLDVIMPGTDGGELAARIQADAFLRAVPIVFLTATVSRTEAAHQGLKSGGFTFLAKPVSMPDLLACIALHLGPSVAPGGTQPQRAEPAAHPPAANQPHIPDLHAPPAPWSGGPSPNQPPP